MELRDLIPSLFDKEEYKLIIERNEKIDPLWKQFNKGVISRDDYIDKHDQIIETYKQKIKELYDEQKTIMSK